MQFSNSRASFRRTGLCSGGAKSGGSVAQSPSIMQFGGSAVMVMSVRVRMRAFPRPLSLQSLLCQLLPVDIRHWFVLQILGDPLAVPDLKMVVLADYDHLARNLSAFSQCLGYEDPALRVHLSEDSVVTGKL